MTFLELSQYARLVFAGMLLFVIGYQLWIARARRDEPMLYLVAAWAGAALFMVVGRVIQHATPDPTTVLLGSRIYHTGVLSLVPLGFALTHEVRLVPRGRLFWICATIGAIPVPLVWIGHWVISDRVEVFQTLAGPILGPGPAVLAPVVLPYLAAVAAYLVYLARKGRRNLPWHQRLSLVVAFGLLLPALANDVLLYAGVITSVEIVGVALFAHILAINVGVFAHAGQLFAGLERTVEDRTAALLARERELSHMLAVRRRILDAIPDVLCLLRDGRIDYVNDAGERFFGKPRSTLTGSPFSDYVLAANLAEAERCLALVEDASQPTTPVNLRFAGPAGTDRWAEVSGLMLELGDGPRMLVSVRDVTERKQLLARLQVADRLASVGTLAAGIAHEINNPLTFVSGNLELIEAAIDRDPDATASDDRETLRQLLDDCTTGTRRIAGIVADLNVFTRADDARSAADCQAILEYALKIAMVTIRHRAAVRLDYGPMPLVSGDARRISQVFLNLLVNAFQSIPDDGASHSIRVSTATRPDGWAVIEIADTGAGIDPEVIDTVFDPFVTTKPVGQGTGLGLFICQGIVTELGGEIRLLPGDPTGTIARVTFPPANTGSATATAEPAAGGRARRTSAAPRVLIADDDELVLRVLARQLRHYDVTAVGSGAEAVRALETTPFDLVLCDLMMPGCNGADVWRMAKEVGIEARFVLMTGGATTQSLREFVDQAGVRCLTKPPSVEDIEAAFAACLAHGTPDEGPPDPT